MKYDRDITPHPHTWYNSHKEEKQCTENGKNKERENQRFTHQRRRAFCVVD